MRVLVTGGTGFIGTHLVQALALRGDECVVVSRSGTDRWRNPNVEVISGDPTEQGDWQEHVAGADAVVNLAGQRLVEPPQRWTESRKRALVESRVESTKRVVEAMRAAKDTPGVLVSASAIGYYGDRGSEVLSESAGAGRGFLADLSVEWENAALDAESLARVVLLRTGIVLDPGDGALAPLVPLFKLGLGGPWGPGDQWWSWIHRDDEIGLILFALDRDVSGPLNLTAPNPVTVDTFASALGAALNRPALIRAPAFAMRLAMGEMADALLGSQRVVPERALDAGYEFSFTELDAALSDLFG